MGDLHVVVRYNEHIVEDRVMPVRDVVRIGDSQDSRVPFPGASVAVCRVDGALDIRGRRLVEGQRTGFSLGHVHVELEHLAPIEGRRRGPVPIDLRFLLVALGITTGGIWVEHFTRLVDAPPAGPVAEMVDSAKQVWPVGESRAQLERRAAVRPPDRLHDLPPAALAGEGREAQNDDQRSGYQYYRWYRNSVPSTLDAELARLKLRDDPSDVGLHAVVARGAYENDNYREALGYYQVLVEVEPDNVLWLSGQAQALKRLGHHQRELDTYRTILALDPDNAHALGNGAVALARMGDFEAAESWLEGMRRLENSSPYLWVYEGMVLALQGRDDEAIAALEEAVAHRESLPDGLQGELRRDLAVDPSLSSLRANRALRTMLWRHYGAAAPRKLRG